MAPLPVTPGGWCRTWPLLLFRARACPGVTGRGAACGTPPSHPPGLVSDVAVAVVQSASVPRGDWEGCGLWHPSLHPRGLVSDMAVAVVQSASVPRGDWEGCGLWHPSLHPRGLVSDMAVAVVQSESVPRGDWEGCGLWHPRPHYSHHVYYSASCRPSHSECLVFHALHQRAPVSVRDTALRISSTDDAESLDTDVKMEAYIRVSLRVA